MKLRGGMWVSDNSDAEALAAHAELMALNCPNPYDHLKLNIDDYLNPNISPNKAVLNKRDSVTAQAAKPSVAQDLTARFIKAMMQ